MLLLKNENLGFQLSEQKANFNLKSLMYNKLLVNFESLHQLKINYTTEIIHDLYEFYSVMEWIGEIENTQRTFYICYKATIDGDTADKFHQNCDGNSPLLFLFETVDGYRFGAYITESILKKDKSVYDSNAFLFSFDTKKKYKVAMPEVAIRDFSHGFPSFGKNDIYIHEGFFNHTKNICTFPQAYKKDEDTYGDYPLTGGLKNFRLKEMEVLTIFSKFIDDDFI